jgi:hypothetical protein
MSVAAAFSLFDDDDSDTETALPPPMLKSLLESVTVPLHDDEKGRSSRFSALTHNASVAVLRKHGMLVLNGLYDADVIAGDLGARALNDMVSKSQCILH